jgi:hypothetical protein
MARQYSKKSVMTTLRLHHGLISLAADALGCSRQTLYNYMELYPEIAAVVTDERERLVDLAEDGLHHHLQEKAPWAIAFVLKSLGKSRGYGEKMPAADTPDSGEALEWQHLQSTLLATLRPYPEARWAVVQALSGNGHESTNGHTPGA